MRGLRDWFQGQTGELNACWDGQNQLALLDTQVRASTEEKITYSGDK